MRYFTCDYEYYTDAAECWEALKGWVNEEDLGFDVETTGLDIWSDATLLFQVSDGVRTMVGLFSKCYSALERFLKGYKGALICHNAKFEYSWMKAEFDYSIQVWDTMLGDLVLRCGVEHTDDNKDLEHCAKRYLGQNLDKKMQKTFIGVDPRTWEPSKAQLQYAACDAALMPLLKRHLDRRLTQEGLQEVMRLENALVPVLAEMELRGMAVDEQQWREVTQEIQGAARVQESRLVDLLSPPLITLRAGIYQRSHEERQDWERSREREKEKWEREADAPGREPFLDRRARRTWITKQLHRWDEANPRPTLPKLAEGPINLNSPPQIKAAFKALGLDLPSTEAEVLQELIFDGSEHTEVLTEFIEWRLLNKLQSAFGEKILARIRDGRIHPDFNQIVRTGRMSCRNPNLQQIPAGKRGGSSAGFAKRIRECFIAPPGRVLVVADYSAIEHRIACELFGEESQIREYREQGELADPHTVCARLMFALPEDWKGKGTSEREIAKIINYRKMFGGSYYGLVNILSQTLGRSVELSEAKELDDKWAKGQPRLTAGLKKSGEDGVRYGESRTKLGRRRTYLIPHQPLLDQYKDRKGWEQYRRVIGGIRRQAQNQPVQGMSADITKIALVNIHRALSAFGDRAFLVNAVHDEVIVECEAKLASNVQKIVVAEMVKAGEMFLHKVPVVVEAQSTSVWSK